MSKKFLSREIIASAAFPMIDENGTDSFSLRGLAAKLGVQVSSLYNHISNEYDLLLEVAKLAAKMYKDGFAADVEGLSPEEAIYRGAAYFNAFVHEHKHLYALLIDSRWSGDPEFGKVNMVFTQPIVYYIEQFHIGNKAEQEHIYVILRSITHGFASLNALGMFDNLSVDPAESYRMLTNSALKLIESFAEKEA